MTAPKQSSRRQFFQRTSSAVAACMAGAYFSGMPQPALAEPLAPARKDRPFKLAMASYSLRKFSLEDALKMTASIGLDAICLKSMHLPLELSDAEIAASVAKADKAGVKIYGGGVITMKTEKDVNRAFDYAKAAGMTKIIGVPSPELLDMVNDKVQQYDIAVCIHNHGPGDNTYTTPDMAYEKIKHLDRRIGLCHDVGHTVRVGKDPAALSEQCADRLLDVHMKDVSAADKSGHSIACGRGVMDLPALMKTFAKINYQGYLSFEYEEDADNPLPGLAESVGYIRGVMDMMV